MYGYYTSGPLKLTTLLYLQFAIKVLLIILILYSFINFKLVILNNSKSAIPLPCSHLKAL